jgi:hypothetical protein
LHGAEVAVFCGKQGDHFVIATHLNLLENITEFLFCGE